MRMRILVLRVTATGITLITWMQLDLAHIHATIRAGQVVYFRDSSNATAVDAH